VRDAETEIDASPYGTPSTQTFVDANLPPSGIRYYRIKIIP
jgi:hypothetical protein